MTWRRWFRSAVGLGAFVLLALGSQEQKPKPPPPPSEIIPVGQSQAVGTFTVTVDSSRKVRKVQQRRYEYKAPSGSKLLLVKTKVRNDDNKAANLLLRLTLFDDQNRKFQPTVACQFGIANPIGGATQINPGVTKSGTICFEVPETATGLQLGFLAGLFKEPVRFYVE